MSTVTPRQLAIAGAPLVLDAEPERRQRAQVDADAAGHRVGAEPPEPIDREDVEALVAAG